MSAASSTGSAARVGWRRRGGHDDGDLFSEPVNQVRAGMVRVHDQRKPEVASVVTRLLEERGTMDPLLDPGEVAK